MIDTLTICMCFLIERIQTNQEQTKELQTLTNTVALVKNQNDDLTREIGELTTVIFKYVTTLDD